MNVHRPNVRRSRLGLLLLTALIYGILATAADAAIVVNGSLSDWGVTVADNDASAWGVGAGTGTRTFGGVTYFYHQEDQSDTSGDGFLLGPNHGGQNYDAEFIGWGWDNGHIVVGISTGQRPDNGSDKFGPGDIRIRTTIGDFGVEVGGSGTPGSPAATSFITEGALGSRYQLNSNGYTTGVTNSDAVGARAQQAAGSVWFNPTWIMDPIAPPTPVQIAYTGGTYIGLADYHYTRNAFGLQHAIIEVSIPVWMFGTLDILGIEWSPSCGNDVVSAGGLVTLHNPEPSSIALVLMAGVSVVAYRRRNRIR
ncbi:MAG: PEP-CTERM sorting domain-containing protein [Planctomycetaceae bacterium]